MIQSAKMGLYSRRYSHARGAHWRHERSVSKDTAAEWLKAFRRDEPDVTFKVMSYAEAMRANSRPMSESKTMKANPKKVRRTVKSKTPKARRVERKMLSKVRKRATVNRTGLARDFTTLKRLGIYRKGRSRGAVSTTRGLVGAAVKKARGSVKRFARNPKTAATPKRYCVIARGREGAMYFTGYSLTKDYRKAIKGSYETAAGWAAKVAKDPKTWSMDIGLRPA